MSKPKGIHINYNDVAEFQAFFQNWASELRRAEDEPEIITEKEVVEGIAEFVRDQIARALVIEGSGAQHGFGAFMARRTKVVVTPKNKQLEISVEGMKESELDEEFRRSSKENPDINLWELYETGVIGKNLGSDKSKKGIAKDIGGVLAIRMGSKFQPMKDSRAGVITQIFSQIRSELLAALPDLIMANTKSKIMDAAGRAIKKSRGSKPKGQVGKPAAPPVVRNLDRLSRWQQRELAEAIKQEQHALSKVSARVEVFANKQVRARGAGGRFVATPVTKVVLRNKK